APRAAGGIVASDVGARLSFVNGACAASVGHAPHELVGTGWLRRIVTDDLPALLGDLERVVVGEPVDRTLRMYGRDRPVRWVRLRLTPTATHHRAGGFIGTVEDVTGRRARESKLAYDATHDALTGLINRRRLMELLKDVYESPARRRHDMALLFCDLDGFKAVNDRFGHDAGDRVLVEVASRLGAEGREDDLVARLAGDEFVVVLRDVTAVDQAVAAAQRRSSALRRPITVEGQLLTVGASIGVAMLRDHGDLTALLRAADAAMYRAKVSGGGVAARQATPEQESA
ncbi:MAG: diguanylate cyclase domain-containing protein, partial [Jatrophihabitans sp.]|uniref:diguanylate cyclase domain-containing protein n=1 Tax=Jatrophihabitans sp. TaxID=1932789 RepID=UPI003F7E4A8E